MKKLIDLFLRAVNCVHRSTCTFFLGKGDYPAPPALLAVLWVAVTLLRLYPSFKSLWEDEIWMLVVSVDQPWRVVFGFENFYSGNHILYSALSKILLDATHHHWTEFVYRVPAEAAMFLTLPIAFAVFGRRVSRLGGILASLLFCFLPAFAYHAANARGYGLWCFITVWLIGVLPGSQARLQAGRLGAAYFLLAISHSLAVIPLLAFAVFGSWIWTARQRARVCIVNFLLALPGLVLCTVPVSVLMAFDAGQLRPVHHGWQSLFGFIPEAAEAIFGSSVFPGFSLLWVLFIAAGLLLIFKKSMLTGVSVAACGCSMACAMLITQNPYGSFDRIYIGSLPFAFLAVAVFFDRAVLWLEQRSRVPSGRLNRSAICVMCLLFVPWLPLLTDYILLPKQDYRTLFTAYKKEFHGATELFGAGDRYGTGLSYYGRQYGIRYTGLTSVGQIRDSLLLSGIKGRGLVVASVNEVPDTMMTFVRDSLRLYRTFPGNQLTTYLYVAKTDFPDSLENRLTPLVHY
jgi:hypothetical protein